MSYTHKKIATGVGLSHQFIKKRAAKEGWSYTEQTGRGGKTRYYELDDLPADIRGRLTRKEAAQKRLAQRDVEKKAFKYDAETLWESYARKSDKQKEAAKQRVELMFMATDLAISGQCGWTEAFKIAAASDGTISWARLRDLYHGKPGKPGLKLYDRKDWLAAITPNQRGRSISRDIIDPQAYEFFKTDYLRLEQPTATVCYERLKYAAAEHGWKIPSLKTMQRRIQALPVAQRVLLRQGNHAMMRLFPPQERSVLELNAMEHINGDGYKHNVFIRWPNGEVDRPKTWFWQDIYSGKILAWRTDISENADMIRLSFGDLVEQYGIPNDITIDNTRAAANKWMTGGTPNRYRFKVKDDDPLGIWPTLGIKVHWTSVNDGKGHGQAKPIERAFGIGGLEEYIDKDVRLAGCYTGANPNAKPENYGSKAVDLEEFLDIVAHGVAMFNAKDKRQRETCMGVKSFDQVFAESYGNALVRKATAEQRRLWMLAAESIRVNQQGTFKLEAGAIKGETTRRANRYGGNDELLQIRGQKIIIRFDPDDLHNEVHCYTLDNRYICTAECIEAASFNDTNTARTHTRERRRWMKATKVAATASKRMSELEAQALMPNVQPPEAPDSKVVRPVFGQKKVAGSDVVVDDIDELVTSADNLILSVWESQKSQQEGE